MQLHETQAAHIDPSLWARLPKFVGRPEEVGANAWVNMMRMYLGGQPHLPESSNILKLLNFLHKHEQTLIKQKTTAARDTCDKFLICCPEGSMTVRPLTRLEYFWTGENKIAVRNLTFFWMILSRCGLELHEESSLCPKI